MKVHTNEFFNSRMTNLWLHSSSRQQWHFINSCIDSESRECPGCLNSGKRDEKELLYVFKQFRAYLKTMCTFENMQWNRSGEVIETYKKVHQRKKFQYAMGPFLHHSQMALSTYLNDSGGPWLGFPDPSPFFHSAIAVTILNINIFMSVLDIIHWPPTAE